METGDLIRLTLVVAAIASLYWYLRSMFNYWKDRGIPTVPLSVIFGNIKDMILARTTFYEMQADAYNSLNGHKYGGSYDLFKPSLLVRDPELIERILIKDFNHFMDRGTPPSREDDILSMNVANAEGERWRSMRYKLTPTFTSGKLKGMFEQIDRCCDDLIRYIDEESANGDGQLEAKPMMNRYSMNVIATCAFGIEFAYHDKERDRFLAMVKKLTVPSLSLMLRVFAQIYCPSAFKIFRIKMFVPEASDYFIGLVKEAFRYRTKENTKRNDFLQLLLDLKKDEENGVNYLKEDTAYCDPEDAIINQMHHVSGQEEKPLAKINLFSLESITAQAVVFLTAGAEGGSGLMTFFMFAVATNPDIQSKLHNEVDTVLSKHGKWNYQMLKEMTYVDQVMQETMRMYPATILLMRKCTKSYQLPDTDVVLEPGTQVIIPMFSLHYDPQYYPEPQKFDPDRFVDTNYKPNGRFLPFGDGPRICIAMRFALLQMKLGLAHLIAEYTVSLGSKTLMPLQFERRGFTMIPKGGIWLKFEKRKVQ